jgi:hypothetical protein
MKNEAWWIWIAFVVMSFFKVSPEQKNEFQDTFNAVLPEELQFSPEVDEVSKVTDPEVRNALKDLRWSEGLGAKELIAKHPDILAICIFRPNGSPRRTVQEVAYAINKYMS